MDNWYFALASPRRKNFDGPLLCAGHMGAKSDLDTSTLWLLNHIRGDRCPLMMVLMVKGELFGDLSKNSFNWGAEHACW